MFSKLHVSKIKLLINVSFPFKLKVQEDLRLIIFSIYFIFQKFNMFRIGSMIEHFESEINFRMVP